jgi:pSer/pThr/pTyr-binding forkhead associated (FHA) protein
LSLGVIAWWLTLFNGCSLAHNKEMILRLIIEEGPRAGEEFVVKADIVIGRSGGDLKLKDTKASKQHAKISINEKGECFLEDLKSANGTILNGLKIIKAPIKPGDVFVIGRSKIKIQNHGQGEHTSSEIEKGSWQQEVHTALNSALESPEVKPTASSPVLPFIPALSLEFVKGIQKGTIYYLAYGPRKVGAACSEFMIFESDAPTVAFELTALANGGCRFSTDSSIVLVNELETREQNLQDGDEIKIGHTVIKIKALLKE